MNIPQFPYLQKDFFHLIHIHHPTNLTNGIRVGRLQSDFQLYESRSHRPEYLNLLFPDPICRNLKMKIRHSIIMLRQISPYCKCMTSVTVKRPIDEFHLGHAVCKEEIQLIFD